MKRLSLIFFVAGFAAVVASNAPPTAAQTNIGYVSEVRGDWSANGRRIRSADNLPASALVSASAPASGDYIKIADLNGTVRINRACDSPCSFRLPAAPSSSMFSVLYDSVVCLVWGCSSNRYSKHISKGGELSDGVAQVQKGKIDLSGLLKSRTKNYVQWRTISKDVEFGERSAPIEVSDDKTANVGDLKPGLYEFSLLKKSGDEFEERTTAWVLIAATKNYKKSVAALEKLKKYNADLTEEDTAPETRDGFVKILLNDLAVKNAK